MEAPISAATATATATPLRNSYWVRPPLLLAGEYPADFSPDVAKNRLSALLAAGIRTFIDLTDEDEPAVAGRSVPGYRPLLRQLADDARISITYARIPIVDRDIPSVWTMRIILDLIDRSIADELPVYVHCWAGRGRTGTVIGCHLRRHDIAQSTALIPKIAELRQAMPSGRESSPHTPPQIRMAKGWKVGA